MQIFSVQGCAQAEQTAACSKRKATALASLKEGAVDFLLSKEASRETSIQGYACKAGAGGCNERAQQKARPAVRQAADACLQRRGLGRQSVWQPAAVWWSPAAGEGSGDPSCPAGQAPPTREASAEHRPASEQAPYSLDSEA